MTHEGKSWAAIKRDTITTAKASRSAYGLVRDVDDGCPSRLSRRRASERKRGEHTIRTAKEFQMTTTEQQGRRDEKKEGRKKRRKIR